MDKNKKIAAVVLAAGKGVRMQSKKINKVMLPLVGQPMIFYTIDLLRKLKVGKIAMVIGFAKNSVKNFLGQNFIYVEQKKRLGTAHAVKCALSKMPASFETILVLNGDDSAFYRPEMVKMLIKKHQGKKAALTLLTIDVKKPKGLGRIMRDKRGKIVGIIEEKDASVVQRKIREVNPACYVFERVFLEKYLPKIKKSHFSGEYYLTDLVEIGVRVGEKIESLKFKNALWRGINTWEELRQAEKMMRRLKSAN